MQVQHLQEKAANMLQLKALKMQQTDAVHKSKRHIVCFGLLIGNSDLGRGDTLEAAVPR